MKLLSLFNFLLRAFRLYIVLSVFCVLWFIYSYNKYKKSRKDKLNLENRITEYDFCRRVDHSQTSFFRSLLASIIYCPSRVLLFGTLVILIVFSLLILKVIGTIIPSIKFTTYYRYAHILIVRFAGFSTLRLFGVIQTDNFILENEEKYSKSDVYKCTYSCNPPKMDSTVTIVSNHISMLDVSFFMKYVACGFVAQKEICKNYILGTVADIIGCIYVDRNCKETRSKAKSLIKERQLERYKIINSNETIELRKWNKYWFNVLDLSAKMEKKIHTNLLVIFPEGTTTNGTTIIPFKTGAFESLTPVQPVVLHYNYSIYSPAFDVIPFWVLICLLFCNYGVITLSAYWLPKIHPDKNGIGEERVKCFAEAVRYKMCQVMREIREKDKYKRCLKKNGYIETEFEINLHGNKEDFNTRGSLRMKKEYVKMLE
ncbi:hypothetical protein FG386_003174 [Cryptosporidium ryanae]|uniref:uncharacterized protein n=1 Tax=Cryptosporidium ryanae TaxID=515981 RepID=UPI00351AA189|nr:hypothetical protein FG386_003174 [Cryptosporidium ryanae]